MKIRRRLEQAQFEWATARGLQLKNGVEGRPIGQVADLKDNFFQPLDAESRNEFLRGAGGELNPPEGASGHLYSLASSSALAVNFFMPWRRRDASALIKGMGVEESRYEWEFDPRLRLSKQRVETPPVDLLLTPKTKGLPVVAVEAKFCEPYDEKPRRGLPDFYLTRRQLFGNWPRITRIAKAMQGAGDEQHRYLHAAQTVRQLLALRKNYGAHGFVLFHLWYDTGGLSGLEYRAELEEFSMSARQDRIAFAAVSWQELYSAVAAEAGPEMAKWREYMEGRYRLKAAEKASR